MLIRLWIVFMAAALAFGQEVVPFPQEPPEPWKPAWELTLRGDQLSDPRDATESFRRAGLQLRLRWSWESEAFHLEVGTRSALGSDGNRLNAPRWDQQPSNGTQMDVARADLSWVREKSFGTLSLGFQENGLMASQAIWDRDLRYSGLGALFGVRSGGGLLQEASLRGAFGRSRNILGGQVDLAAGQIVVKLDTGPWSWSAHAGRWRLSWEAGEERLRRLPGQDPALRQQMVLDAIGAAGKWNSSFPLELRYFGSKNRDSSESSEEVQATAGSRERTYWPQASFTWQRLSSTGTLYPVNGDEWWFYRRAQGSRLDISLPLPGRWIATFTHLRQRAEGVDYPVTRRMLILVKRF